MSNTGRPVRRLGFGLAVLAALAMIAVACGDDDAAKEATTPAGTSSPAGTTAAASPTPSKTATLKIGIQMPLTGPGASVGIPVDRLIRMGLDDLNAQGGVVVGDTKYVFEAVSADEKATAAGGAEAANALALKEGVKFVLGGTSTAGGASQPIYEENKIFQWSTVLATAAFSPKFPLTSFQIAPHDLQRAQTSYEWLKKNRPEVKKIAIIGYDNATGQGANKAIEQVAKALGFTIVANELIPATAADYTPNVIRVLAANPDVIDLGAQSARGALMVPLVQTVIRQGFKGNSLFVSLSVDASAMEQVKDQAEGMTGLTPAPIDFSTLTAKEQDIIKRYIAKYGQAEFQATALATYNMPIVLAQAITKAQSIDPAKVAPILRDGTWQTVYGTGSFGGGSTLGIKGVFNAPFYLIGVRSGKVTDIARADAAALP